MYGKLPNDTFSVSYYSGTYDSNSVYIKFSDVDYINYNNIILPFPGFFNVTCNTKNNFCVMSSTCVFDCVSSSIPNWAAGNWFTIPNTCLLERSLICNNPSQGMFTPCPYDPNNPNCGDCDLTTKPNQFNYDFDNCNRTASCIWQPNWNNCSLLNSTEPQNLYNLSAIDVRCVNKYMNIPMPEYCCQNGQSYTLTHICVENDLNYPCNYCQMQYNQHFPNTIPPNANKDNSKTFLCLFIVTLILLIFSVAVNIHAKCKQSNKKNTQPYISIQ